MLNVGLIGLDGHQGVVLNTVAARSDLRLAAVASERPDALDAMRRNKAVAADTAFYTRWQDLVEKENLDILAVCSPTDQHAAQIQAGAARGWHICSEKPLAANLSELIAVQRSVALAGVKLTMLLTMRYEPPYLCLRDIVRSGVLGEVCLASVQKSYRLGNRAEWMRSRKTFGGTIPFVGIHALDLVRWTSGREFVECMAYHGNTGHPGVREMEDQASVLLKLDNGGSATARIDYCRPAAAETHGDDRLRLAGSKGVAEVMGGQVTVITETEALTCPEMPPHGDLFADFVSSITDGREPLLTAADCFRMTEIVLKARDAADTGTLVSLHS